MDTTRKSERPFIAFLKKGTVEQACSIVDSSWKGIYKVGGICLLASGIIFIVVALLSIVLGPPPSSAETYLQALAAHGMAAKLNFGLYALSDLLFIPVILALYLALKPINKNAMLIAGGLFAFYIVIDFGVTELNSLMVVSLAQNYASAATGAQRAAALGAATYALSTLPLATFCSYFISSVALVIAGIVMLKGVFNRPTALLALTAGVEGILGAFYGIVPALAGLLGPALIAYGLWALLGGVRLVKIANRLPA